MKRASVLMVQGTASGVGKSWVVTALCRLLYRRGFAVAPFKAQNMSNNAAATLGGGEIGRAQAVQAAAAGIEPDVRMNPVLLKPLDDMRSDVVVMGWSRPEIGAMPWTARRDLLWPVVTAALDSLRMEVDWVIVEGAGSPAEVNLASSDIVNMAVARHASAPVLLVADIDRGGAFAAALGTWHLLPTADRQLLRGFILNRFRGDITLLGGAPDELEQRTGLPVLGVVPWVEHRLPEEDAAVLERKPAGRGRVGVIRLPHLANFDDVLPLEGDPEVGVRWVERVDDLDGVAAVVIPGTRNTAADLDWLCSHDLGTALRRYADRGGVILGVCGGLQILGEEVIDLIGIEQRGIFPGLGLLPLRTEIVAAKRVSPVRVSWTAGADAGELKGYEIHHGVSTVRGSVDVFMRRQGFVEAPVGFRRGKVWGTYVHGCLSDASFRRAWLETAGLRASRAWDFARAIDGVADTFEAAVRLEELLETPT